MTRAAAIVGAALAVLALSAGGGQGSGRNGKPADGVRITSEQPAALLQVETPGGLGGNVLGLRILHITNPRMVPFGVVVSLPDGPEIGRFAVYPPDRTGDYMLSLEPAERARLAEAGEVAARLDLFRPAPGLAVEIATTPGPPARGQ